MNPRRLTDSTAAARRMGVALALAGLIWPVAAIGQVESSASFRARGWRQVGPGPAPIEAAIAAHAPSHTVYIGSLGGVLKSTDGGVTFVSASNGIEGVGATSMAMDPNDPNIVYLGSNFGTFKTTDGAKHLELHERVLARPVHGHRPDESEHRLFRRQWFCREDDRRR